MPKRSKQKPYTRAELQALKEQDNEHLANKVWPSYEKLRTNLVYPGEVSSCKFYQLVQQCPLNSSNKQIRDTSGIYEILKNGWYQQPNKTNLELVEEYLTKDKPILYRDSGRVWMTCARQLDIRTCWLTQPISKYSKIPCIDDCTKCWQIAIEKYYNPPEEIKKYWRSI